MKDTTRHISILKVLLLFCICGIALPVHSQTAKVYRLIDGSMPEDINVSFRNKMFLVDTISQKKVTKKLIPTWKNGKYGFTDKFGNEKIPFTYDKAWPFSEGLALVQIMVNKEIPRVGHEGLFWIGVDDIFCFIDTTGKEIIRLPKDYNGVGQFHEGFALIQKGLRYGYIDKTGREAIPAIYSEAFNFNKGLAIVHKQGVGYGCINKAGNEIVSCQYGGFKDFLPIGLAPVYKKPYWGFVDTSGKEVIPCIYEHYFVIDDQIKVTKSKKETYIDYTGKLLFPFIYEQIDLFSDSLLRAFNMYGDNKNQQCGLIDYNGKIILPLDYLEIDELSCGLAIIRKWKGLDLKYGYIDKNGRIIISITYDKADEFRNNVAVVLKNNKYGVIDTAGKTVIPFEYDEIDNFRDDELIEVEKDGQRFFFNHKGEIQLDK